MLFTNLIPSYGSILTIKNVEARMDWDEPGSASNQGPVLSEVLERLSIDELRARVTALKAEISRVEQEIEKRQAHQNQAEQIFKG